MIQPTERNGRRGRRPASESRAAEIRARLTAWKETSDPQRVSLRALAIQIGTSHQLLSFYLKRLGKWQMKEYERKAKEIRVRAESENRPMTQGEEAQMSAYERAALGCLLDSMAGDMLRKLRAQARRGGLSRIQLRIAKLLARKGYRNEVQRILDTKLKLLDENI